MVWGMLKRGLDKHKKRERDLHIRLNLSCRGPWSRGQACGAFAGVFFDQQAQRNILVAGNDVLASQPYFDPKSDLSEPSNLMSSYPCQHLCLFSTCAYPEGEITILGLLSKSPRLAVASPQALPFEVCTPSTSKALDSWPDEQRGRELTVPGIQGFMKGFWSSRA